MDFSEENEEQRQCRDISNAAARADKVDPTLGAAAGRWVAEKIQIALTNRESEYIYPVNTRVILPLSAEEGEESRPPLHGRIAAFIQGRGAYADPLTPFHPKRGGEEDLPHYVVDYVHEAGGERLPCDDVHGRWQLCSPRLLKDADYTLEEMDRQDPRHACVVEQFQENWRHPAPFGLPRVERVLRIRNSPHVLERFEAKCAELKHRRGDEHVMVRCFHGTGASCDFGIAPNVNGSRVTPCQHADCAICNVCCTGFQSAKVRMLKKGRFGTGLYFSETSSKSNDYAERTERIIEGECFRAMLVCDVAAGKPYGTKKGLPFWKHEKVEAVLAKGYDSFRGMPGNHAVPGEVLNYDELVVYDQEQVVPAFLVVYALPRCTDLLRRSEDLSDKTMMVVAAHGTMMVTPMAKTHQLLVPPS